MEFDLRRLCNGNADYVMTDPLGHTYYAQICGTAGKSCLPSGWENEYEYGRVIQTWGSPPTPCDMSCVEERTGAPTCCSEPCQVIAVQQPVFTTIQPGDPTQGIMLTYFGETPTGSDVRLDCPAVAPRHARCLPATPRPTPRTQPYACDFNPATGAPYPRVTHMQFYCDPTVAGFAKLYEVDQNATDDCDYTLKFKTSAVCMPGISGGWIFCIIVMAGFGAYAIFGTLVTYWRERIWCVSQRCESPCGMECGQCKSRGRCGSPRGAATRCGSVGACTQPCPRPAGHSRIATSGRRWSPSSLTVCGLWRAGSRSRAPASLSAAD